MALDFGLLNTNAPAQIAGAYGRGQQEAQANLLAEQQLQHVQNQNALSKYQIDAARMQNEQQNALNTKYAGGGFDPMSNDTHLKQLYGMGAPGRAQAGEILKYRADQRKAEESAVGTAIKRHGVYQKSMGALATEADLTKDTVSATLDKLVANGIFSQAARDTIVQNLPDDPAALRASVMQDAKANLTGKDQLTAFLPELMVAGGNLVNKNPLALGGAGAVVAPVAPVAPAPPTSAFEYKLAQEDPKFMRFLQERAAATRAPIQPVAPTITQIVDPTNPNQMISVDARRYQGGGVGSAGVIGVGGKEPGVGSMKPLTEGQNIKLRTDVGKDYKAASTALSQIDDLLASATAVKTSPGLSAATGFTGKYLPSFSEGGAAQAETRLANLRGKVTALGKATAAMSGAIGSIANQEWKILSDQIAVLDETKGTKPLLEQIGLLENQAKGAADRIRDTYEKTRAEDFERFPQFRDLPVSKSSAPATPAPNIDALLNKYK